MPNSPNRRPDLAGHEGDRDKDRHEYHRRCDDGEADLPAAGDRGQQRRLTLLDVPDDILQHDDRVVDDQANRQHEPEQRQRIDRVAEHGHDGERGYDGHRDRQRGNRRRANRPEEGKNYDQNHRERHGQGLQYLLHGFADEHREIDCDDDVDIVRQALPDAIQLFRHAAVDREDVGLRLRDHAETHPRHRVRACHPARALRLYANFRDVAQPHDVVVGRSRQDQRGEVRRAAQLAVGTQAELAIRRLDAAGRQLDVLPPQHLLDVLNGQLPCCQGLPVEPDAHRQLAGAAEPDRSDARHHGQAVDDVPLRVVGELHGAATLARQVDVHRRVEVRVLFRDLRRVGFLRQHAQDARDALAGVVRRGVDVAIDGEFDVDVRFLVLAGRLQLLDAGDTGELILDNLGDPPFDDLGGRAAVERLDRDNRRVHVRILAHRQAVDRQQAEDNQHEADHRREDRAADGDVGNQHGGSFRTPRRSRRPRRYGPSGCLR